jgi:two-component system CheB/CheR fusion protein
MLSHELRNPLGTILNATYVLQERDSTADDREESVQILQRQGEQMSRLLDDLLDVARLTQNKIQIKVEPINLIDVITEAILVCKPEVERSRLRLEYKHRSGALPIEGDSVRLQQVMVNLIKNALKYTPSGGVVEVSTRRQGDVAEIRVEDSGIGLAPDMLERVFDLFVQADPGIDRSDGGMGVGLTLARSIIERHGGFIKACSDGVGKGSQFVVELPLREAGDEAQKQPLRTVSKDRPEKLHVVIVEDNDDSRRMLETLLSLEGCQVTSTSTGIEGLEAIVKQRPSLALIDIGLPVMSGYDVARKVRSAPGGGEIRLIALTGYGRAEDQQRVIEAGFDEHLIKPLRREALMHVLDETRRSYQ